MDRRGVQSWAGGVISGALLFAMMLLGGEGWAPDRTLLQLLHVGHSGGLTRTAAVITSLGGWPLLTALAVAVGLYVSLTERARAAFLLLTVFGGRLAVELMKLVVDRERPLEGQLVLTHSMSFPSGHAANAMITYGAIALLLPLKERHRVRAVGVAAVLALLSGASRVALGVHWPSDVLGGWAFGLLWLWLCFCLWARHGRPSRARARSSIYSRRRATRRGSLTARAAGPASFCSRRRRCRSRGRDARARRATA